MNATQMQKDKCKKANDGMSNSQTKIFTWVAVKKTDSRRTQKGNITQILAYVLGFVFI